jgi:hypothetical protein
MAGRSFASYRGPAALIDAQLEDGVLRLRMSGSVEERDPGALYDPYWQRLDAEVRRAGVQQVELDICALDYMNSSGILTLVRWMMKVKEDPAYQIVIRHDRELTWQKTNVPVLAKLAPAVVRVAQS